MQPKISLMQPFNMHLFVKVSHCLLSQMNGGKREMLIHRIPEVGRQTVVVFLTMVLQMKNIGGLWTSTGIKNKLSGS